MDARVVSRELGHWVTCLDFSRRLDKIQVDSVKRENFIIRSFLKEGEPKRDIITSSARASLVLAADVVEKPRRIPCRVMVDRGAVGENLKSVM
jgi:hypothetical protein